MKKILVNGVEYEIIRNDNDCISSVDMNDIVTDYFDGFDYIVGDFSYEKVRLKGFYASDNKRVKDINDIKYLDQYIQEFCNFGSKIFVIKK